MAKKRLKKGRVLLAMFVVAGSVFAADNLRRDLLGTEKTNLVVDGSFKNSSEQRVEKPTEDMLNLSNGNEATTAFQGVQYLGFSELNIPSSQLSSGALVIVDEEHPAGDVSTSGMVDVFDYKNEYYTLVSDSVVLNENAADALNMMMSDYHAATGLTDFILYGTTETYTGDGSFCPEFFPESALGTCIDLAVNGYAGVLAYDGYDEEAWIIENCYKYGFIVRNPKGKEAITSKQFCPWHLRYVGDVHAAIIEEQSFCLEEYIEFLKGYTFDKPFAYNLNGVSYEIYSIESMGDSTSARVPVSGNYTISGNNMGGYIITTVKS